jgi:hypothetical protein
MSVQVEGEISGTTLLVSGVSVGDDFTMAGPLPARAEFDFERLEELVMRMLGFAELQGDLIKAARDNEANDESFLNNMGHIADTFADVTCEILDRLHKRT